MTTAKQHSQIDKKVYEVDRLKNANKVVREDYTFSVGSSHRNKQKFKVIKTIDTNSFQNIQGYDVNGFQGMAVVPMNKDGEVNYSHITVAYAGTNQSDSKDIAEDLQEIGAGNRRTLDVGEEGQHNILGSQFNSALKFYRQVHADFPDARIDTTGHSLGGTMILFVAPHFQVGATVFLHRIHGRI